MPQNNDWLETCERIAETAFYLISAVIIVLTYWQAKKGILNSVNTEYQKRVMRRLHKLSKELYSEFDDQSPNYWLNQRVVEDALPIINRQFEEGKEYYLEAREWHGGIPCTEDQDRLSRQLGSIVSDPFVPKNIRDLVVDLLEKRLEAVTGTYIEAFERYCNELGSVDVPVSWE